MVGGVGRHEHRPALVDVALVGEVEEPEVGRARRRTRRSVSASATPGLRERPADLRRDSHAVQRVGRRRARRTAGRPRPGAGRSRTRRSARARPAARALDGGSASRVTGSGAVVGGRRRRRRARLLAASRCTPAATDARATADEGEDRAPDHRGLLSSTSGSSAAVAVDVGAGRDAGAREVGQRHEAEPAPAPRAGGDDRGIVERRVGDRERSVAGRDRRRPGGAACPRPSAGAGRGAGRGRRARCGPARRRAAGRGTSAFTAVGEYGRRNATTRSRRPSPSGSPTAASTTSPSKPARSRAGAAATGVTGAASVHQAPSSATASPRRGPPAAEPHRARPRARPIPTRNARTPSAPASTSRSAPRRVPGMCWSNSEVAEARRDDAWGGRRRRDRSRGPAGRRAGPGPRRRPTPQAASSRPRRMRYGSVAGTYSAPPWIPTATRSAAARRARHGLAHERLVPPGDAGRRRARPRPLPGRVEREERHAQPADLDDPRLERLGRRSVPPPTAATPGRRRAPRRCRSRCAGPASPAWLFAIAHRVEPRRARAAAAEAGGASSAFGPDAGSCGRDGERRLEVRDREVRGAHLEPDAGEERRRVGRRDRATPRPSITSPAKSRRTAVPLPAGRCKLHAVSGVGHASSGLRLGAALLRARCRQESGESDRYDRERQEPQLVNRLHRIVPVEPSPGTLAERAAARIRNCPDPGSAKTRSASTAVGRRAAPRQGPSTRGSVPTLWPRLRARHRR